MLENVLTLFNSCFVIIFHPLSTATTGLNSIHLNVLQQGSSTSRLVFFQHGLVSSQPPDTPFLPPVFWASSQHCLSQAACFHSIGSNNGLEAVAFSSLTSHQ
ncbi:hypothetical protein B0J15DRAFT_101009 [Fusarium solani]|uniref:Secreted protein n=1 Tax=Fusarium solani TaxID=169388 RepID=A0A9P9L3U3_FUSSL|nr:uncharacterized protein B0J15DRAFT_101009 [Fusarium solani]KAH7273476.1 hypothetical protein B0J15DRAFT_101009 [Fusarium solani]